MIASRRVTTALVTAFALSGVCTYILSRSMNRQAELHRQQTVRYVAPSRLIQSGEVLKAADLELISWPASNPIHGGFVRVDEALGRASLYPLDPGQPVLDRELSAPGSGTGLASRIPDGMRAIALQSDEVVGVAGFISPGSRVDVLVTFRGGGGTEPVTATVLQNSEVIAVGQQVEPDPAGKPVTATVVTLLLTPVEAERALLASSQGKVHLVLRNSGDSVKTENHPVSLSELDGEPSPNSHLAPLEPVVLPTPAVVIPRVKPAGPVVPKPSPVETILGEVGQGAK